MNNVSLETLKAAYAKAQELGRTHVRFNESGKAAYYQASAKNGAYSLQEIQDRIIDLDCPLEAVVFEDDEMPTHKEFIELGFELEVGDVIFNGKCFCSVEIPKVWCGRGFLDLSIKSLAPRKNMGVQPCGDDCLVTPNVKGSVGVSLVKKAMYWNWSLGDAYPVTHWIPSKENFIKPQPEQAPVSDTRPSDATDYVKGLESEVESLKAIASARESELCNAEEKLESLGYKLFLGQWISQAEIDERNGREMFELHLSERRKTGVIPTADWSEMSDESKGAWITIAKQYTKK